MKYIIMTEGTCEKAFIDVIIDKDLFVFPIKCLLYEQIFHARQINQKLIEKINQLPANEKITIIRIGDKLSNKLLIPEEIENKVVKCLKICIKPEFEILHLIFQKEDSKYIRNYKSKFKPSEYLHSIDCKYEKSYEYNYSFFNKIPNKDLIFLIKEYSNKRKKVHNNDELLLEEILKKDV